MFKKFSLALLTACFATCASAQAIPFVIGNGDKEARKISVVVDAGITRTVQLRTRSLREARLDMIAKKVVSEENLRALADRKDGLAAAKLVDILVGQGLEQNASDIAYYGAIAVGTGRIWPLDEVVEAMQYLDPATEPRVRKNQLIKTLYPHAWAGNTLALQAVIENNGEGLLFGKLSESTRQKILEQADKTGDGRAELRLALAIMKAETLSEEAEANARSYLTRAKSSQELTVQVTAANLLALLDERQK